jgi:hypothetical protein
MDPKQFYQKLSELTYWEIPGHGRLAKTTNVKQTAKVKALKEQRVSNYRDPMEVYPELAQGWVPPEIEDEVIDDEEELDLEPKPKRIVKIIEDRTNLTVTPRIIAIKNCEQQCGDCGDRVKDRRIIHQRVCDPKPHWRHWCGGCNLYWNPVTKTYSIASQYAFRTISSEINDANE